ncbi:sulfatase family protein [Flammeovirga aprica]|uniref:Sulfatase n=1 Tax=Flammeovirga aprica JL-4 TaxID=694437 RepID=A0A7X9RT52_9BACT|nr:sulfatase [Flammeovirga aprica]NME66812.1 sulfatase [Flammeovirga aprica JL-4]
MNNKIFFSVILLFFSLNLQAQNSQKPNIIVLLSDDMGYSDLGCYGSTKIKTPQLDKMASEGILFTDFYVAAPSCGPSRAGFLTGNHPSRIGMEDNIHPQDKRGLNPKEQTIATLLKQNGYETALFGKWHQGNYPEHSPNAHGFKEYYGTPYSHDMWPFNPDAEKVQPPLPIFNNQEIVDYNPSVNQLTQMVTDKAIDFIDRKKDQPFFLYVAYNMPHVPVGSSDQFKGKSEYGPYGDAVMEIDASVGKILETLKKYKIDENTIVMYFTDNGPWLAYGNHAGNSMNFREGKKTTFEGGMRSPFIVRMPGTIPAGNKSEEIISALDILPTVLEMSNTKGPMQPLDGKSILPLLKNEKGAKSPHDALFYTLGNEVQAVRMGKWKLHIPHKYRHVEVVGNDGLRGIQNHDDYFIDLALFDLEKDVGERNNLAEKYPEKVKEMQKAIVKFGKALRSSKRNAYVVE